MQAQSVFDADWMSLDAGAQLGGMQFCTDKARASRIFELWLCQADWLTYLRCSEPTSNGQGVWLASKVQTEGPVAIELRTNDALAPNNSIPFRKEQTIYLGQFHSS
jgi:hypothetical protein